MYEFAMMLSLVFWLLVSAWYATRPMANIYHPFSYYYLFHGIVFVIRPILAYQPGPDPGFLHIHASRSSSPAIRGGAAGALSIEP